MTIDTIQTARRRLQDQLPNGDVRQAVQLASLSRWRIGGPADVVVRPSTVEALARTLRIISETGVPHVVVGDTSNLLFDDGGFRGVVVQIGRSFAYTDFGGDGVVTVGAGTWVPHFVRRTVAHGLEGAVHAIGIPGTIGGLVAMNGGSQRRGIGEILTSARLLDYSGQEHVWTHADFGFAYRHSKLQSAPLVLIEATFKLEAGEARALRRESIAIMQSRRAKFPKIRANCGSVFVSDPALYSIMGPPGLAIEKAGLKGRMCGEAQISPEHANFIVNNGAARSQDVLGLIYTARQRVAELSGVYMEAEVRYLDPTGGLTPAHEVASQRHATSLIPEISQ